MFSWPCQGWPQQLGNHRSQWNTCTSSLPRGGVIWGLNIWYLADNRSMGINRRIHYFFKQAKEPCEYCGHHHWHPVVGQQVRGWATRPEHQALLEEDHPNTTLVLEILRQRKLALSVLPVKFLTSLYSNMFPVSCIGQHSCRIFCESGLTRRQPCCS